MSRLAIESTVFDESCKLLGVRDSAEIINDDYGGHTHSALADHVTNQDPRLGLAKHLLPSVNALQEIRTALFALIARLPTSLLGSQKHEIQGKSARRGSTYRNHNYQGDGSGDLARLGEYNDLFHCLVRQSLQATSHSTSFHGDIHTFHSRTSVLPPDKEWKIFEDLCETIVLGYRCEERSHHIVRISWDDSKGTETHFASDRNAFCQLIICDSSSQSQHQYIVRIRRHAPFTASAETPRFRCDSLESIEPEVSRCSQHQRFPYHCSYTFPDSTFTPVQSNTSVFHTQGAGYATFAMSYIPDFETLSDWEPERILQ